MQDARLLAQELHSEDVRQRRRAAQTLAMLENGAQPAVLELLRGVSDNDEEVQQWCTEALDILGAPLLSDAEAIAELALSAGDSDVQYYAVTMLGRLGIEAEQHTNSLIQCTDIKLSATVRARAIWALSRIVTSSTKEQIVEVVSGLENDSEASVAGAAKRALASF